jgi:PadR family transcriptional regulator PadR
MHEKSLARELKRGTLEMILLKLLSPQPMYGYELIAALEKQGGESFSLKEGTLYPVLYRLEDAGLVETQWKTLDRGVPRKYYNLTKAGIKELQRLISEWQTFVDSVNRLIEMEKSR